MNCYNVRDWVRHEVAATTETILTIAMEAYMSCTFGNDEPILIRMGKGFHDSMVARMSPKDREMTGNLSIFNGARVWMDDRFDSWSAHFYVVDRQTYEKAILFVGATVKLVDGQ